MILSTVLSASLSRSYNPGTTIVVLSGKLSGLSGVCGENLFPEYDLTGIVQIAPFHPLFELEDSDSVDTYTNKQVTASHVSRAARGGGEPCRSELNGEFIHSLAKKH